MGVLGVSAAARPPSSAHRKGCGIFEFDPPQPCDCGVGSTKPDWLEMLFKAVKPLLPPDFIGRIEINVFKGGISNINLNQSFKGDTAQ